jgi:hypothetical protein
MNADNNETLLTKNSRQLTIAKIKATNGKARKIAEYIFPFFKKNDDSVNELSIRLGLNNHSSLSMIRTGVARIPIEKVNVFADVLQCNAFDLSNVIMNSCYRKEYVAMRRSGLIVTKEERRVLDVIMGEIPMGDFDDEMLKKIKTAIS